MLSTYDLGYFCCMEDAEETGYWGSETDNRPRVMDEDFYEDGEVYHDSYYDDDSEFGYYSAAMDW